MVDVDDVMDVIVLQNNLFLLDRGFISGEVERVEGRSKIGVDRLVAEIMGHPIEAECAGTVLLIDDFDVVDIVRGARFGQTRCA